MFRELAGGEWKPGDEAEVLPGAIFQHVLGISIDQVVSILHRNDRRDAPDRFDLLYADFRQSDMADLAIALKIDQRTDLIFHRYLRIAVGSRPWSQSRDRRDMDEAPRRLGAR